MIRIHVKSALDTGYIAYSPDATHLVGYGATYELALEDFTRLLEMHERLQETARHGRDA